MAVMTQPTPLLDLAGRELDLARVRAMLGDDPLDEPRRKDVLRDLLERLKAPYAPESAETVARTVVNVGVALTQGLVPHELHGRVIGTLLRWMSDASGVDASWRSQIALRLGATVFFAKTDPAHCDQIAAAVMGYAAAASAEDDLLEHAVEMLFMATWESTLLDDDYLRVLCEGAFAHLDGTGLSVTMRGRMLHAAANTLAKKRFPAALGEMVVHRILRALPELRAVGSAHYGLLAWALSDAAARDIAKNVPLAALEHLSQDPCVAEEYRAQISVNISIYQVMLAFQNMIDGADSQQDSLFNGDALDIDERLIQGML